MTPENKDILDNLVAEAENKIFNKFNNRAVMPTFVRINNDVIINLSIISSIQREFRTSDDFADYEYTFNELLKDVVTQYTKEHPECLEGKNENEIATEMYTKFHKIVQKNMVDTYGPKPEPFEPVYMLYIKNSETPYFISETVFLQLCDLLGIDMRKDFVEYDR